MSEHVKLPEGMADAFAGRLLRHDSNEIICLGKDAVSDALADVLAQRDQEWRDGLLGDEAKEAAHRAYYLWWDDDDAVREDEPEPDAVRRSYLDAGPLTHAFAVAIDKAAPDQGQHQ